jgi:multicomponent Na+:H+ antiporter subunit D
MMQYPALPVVIPLLVAAALAAMGSLLPRRVVDLLAIFTSAAVCGICVMLMKLSGSGTIVYWFGNWKPEPHGHFPVGICFMIDPIGAGLAALVALLVLAAFLFSWVYFESIKSLYHSLMLVFLAAMCGMCLTGDLFNLFVWFELMTAAAVGLCGYKPDERTPLLGALNFAVSNTVGAFLSLSGVAMLYAFTGSLNMSEVGRSLALHNPGTLFVSIAFLLVITGFLVKAAAFPFHFWLADAHAVAPTPVCILLSGVMVELGVYAIARLYWVIFAPLLGGESEAVRIILITMGCLGAIIGGIFCFGQRHFKRLLAFSTISHVGLMLIALGLMTSSALAGLAMYVVGHGLIKGSLFICAGILLNRFGSVDEFDLRGRGREFAWVSALLIVGACGLAGLPPFATYYGQQFIDHAADEMHLQWLSLVTICAEALTAGAVLRVTGRIFVGWGMVREASSRGSSHIPMKPESKRDERGSAVPVFMWLPAAVLLVLGMAAAAWPGVRGGVQRATDRFRDGIGYQAVVLDTVPSTAVEASAVPAVHLDWKQLLSLTAPVLLAGLALFPGVIGHDANRRVGHWIARGMGKLRLIQSGRVGDYVAWLVLGIAFYGILLILLRGRT